MFKIFYNDGNSIARETSFFGLIVNNKQFITPNRGFSGNSIQLYTDKNEGKYVYIKELNNAIKSSFILSSNTELSVVNLDSLPESASLYQVPKLIQGTASNRPNSPDVGYIYKNTDTGKWEIFNGSSWENLDGTELA